MERGIHTGFTGNDDMNTQQVSVLWISWVKHVAVILFSYFLLFYKILQAG